VIDENGAPRVVQRAYAPAGPAIDIDADALGVRFVVASVDADVFASVGAVVVALFATASAPAAAAASLLDVRLDATTPASTIAVPGVGAGEPLWARIRALPANGGAGSLLVREGPVAGRVDVASADVMPPAAVDVKIERAPAATMQRYPSLTVTV